MKSWKSWPYWVRGLAVGVCLILFLVATLSFTASLSSLCGFNTQEALSHSCNGAERISFFFEGLRFLLILPFTSPDGNVLGVIVTGVVGFCTLLGYLYGKFKNRKKINN